MRTRIAMILLVVVIGAGLPLAVSNAETVLHPAGGDTSIDKFKVLYGGGVAYYGADRQGQGGVIWTIKEGEVFDARALLREAEWYVAQDK